ncbi:cytochrome C biogenesis protein CcdA, partial [Rhizobium johnstonii]
MMNRVKIGTALLGLTLAGIALPALAQPQSGPQTGVVFRNTVTGE